MGDLLIGELLMGDLLKKANKNVVVVVVAYEGAYEGPIITVISSYIRLYPPISGYIRLYPVISG